MSDSTSNRTYYAWASGSLACSLRFSSIIFVALSTFQATRSRVSRSFSEDDFSDMLWENMPGHFFFLMVCMHEV